MSVVNYNDFKDRVKQIENYRMPALYLPPSILGHTMSKSKSFGSLIRFKDEDNKEYVDTKIEKIPFKNLKI